eukprot:2760288-Amphidinium_carterae.1
MLSSAVVDCTVFSCKGWNAARHPCPLDLSSLRGRRAQVLCNLENTMSEPFPFPPSMQRASYQDYHSPYKFYAVPLAGMVLQHVCEKLSRASG